MIHPRACPECLRRAQLIAHLAPYIETAGIGEPGPLAPELFKLTSADLAAAVAPQTAEQILAQVEATPERQLRDQLEQSGCWALCKHDPEFPIGLRDAAGAPWALFGRGDPVLLARLCPEGAVTVVGSKSASAYGREVARELGHDLAGSGLLVISGLSFGVDVCVHRGALEAGLTVAVLGCGADIPYPLTHRSLWHRICNDGLVLSELPPGCSAWRWSFPACGRIMAALAGMTVVVEATERSGPLLTAEHAAGLGRDVGAVPGPVNSRASAGTNELLAGGACLIRIGQDVLDAMLGAGAREVRCGPQLTRAQREVLEALEDGAQSIEEIARDTDLPRGEAEASLSDLIALGYAEGRPTCAYSPSALQAPPQD